MTKIVIETKNLTKRYHSFTAVDGLNLVMQAGEVFGLLGPNGSGKTTTILMLLGLTEPTEGTVRVLGFDPLREPLTVKARVGYLPDQVGFYNDLTARENLIYIAKLNGLPRREAHERTEEMLARMGLSDVADQRVATFSRGMQQRLGLAEILLKHPPVIILDEPTLGLDPEAAREFLNTLRRLKEQGITMLLASHLLHQVQIVCDRVGLFYRGKIVLEGTVKELARRFLRGVYRIHVEAEGSGLEKALRDLPGVVSVKSLGTRVYELEAGEDLRAEAARVVTVSGGRLLSLHLEEPSLAEVYARYFEEVAHGSSTRPEA